MLLGFRFDIGLYFFFRGFAQTNDRVVGAARRINKDGELRLDRADRDPPLLAIILARVLCLQSLIPVELMGGVERNPVLGLVGARLIRVPFVHLRNYINWRFQGVQAAIGGAAGANSSRLLTYGAAQRSKRRDRRGRTGPPAPSIWCVAGLCRHRAIYPRWPWTDRRARPPPVG